MKTLVLAEKPSVGKDIARVLHCKSKDTFMENNKYVVTWALGHLVTLADPESYNIKYKTWNIDELPIIPNKIKLSSYLYLHNEKVRISLIACHDGTLYGIYGVSKEFENRYHLVYNKFKGQMSDENDIKRLVMTELYLYNDKLSEKKKLFHVEKL